MVVRSNILILTLVLLASCAGSRTWTKGDYIREGAYLAVHTVDWRQTRRIAEQPDQYRENNLILGEHPSVGRVNTYFAATTVGHILITHAIPHPYRAWWQYVTIGVSSAYVVNNYNIGLRVDW